VGLFLHFCIALSRGCGGAASRKLGEAASWRAFARRFAVGAGGAAPPVVEYRSLPELQHLPDEFGFVSSL